MMITILADTIYANIAFATNVQVPLLTTIIVVSLGPESAI